MFGSSGDSITGFASERKRARVEFTRNSLKLEPDVTGRGIQPQIWTFAQIPRRLPGAHAYEIRWGVVGAGGTSPGRLRLSKTSSRVFDGEVRPHPAQGLAGVDDRTEGGQSGGEHLLSRPGECGEEADH
jgi:hypothetical protein